MKELKDDYLPIRFDNICSCKLSREEQIQKTDEYFDDKENNNNVCMILLLLISDFYSNFSE